MNSSLSLSSTRFFLPLVPLALPLAAFPFAFLPRFLGASSSLSSSLNSSSSVSESAYTTFFLAERRGVLDFLLEAFLPQSLSLSSSLSFISSSSNSKSFLDDFLVDFSDVRDFVTGVALLPFLFGTSTSTSSSSLSFIFTSSVSETSLIGFFDAFVEARGFLMADFLPLFLGASSSLSSPLSSISSSSVSGSSLAAFLEMRGFLETTFSSSESDFSVFSFLLPCSPPFFPFTFSAASTSFPSSFSLTSSSSPSSYLTEYLFLSASYPTTSPGKGRSWSSSSSRNTLDTTVPASYFGTASFALEDARFLGADFAAGDFPFAAFLGAGDLDLPLPFFLLMGGLFLGLSPVFPSPPRKRFTSTMLRNLRPSGEK
mmetsp:Transcript_13157/g.28449  ORF Transcript_13157/g.28449 Transcript_13157/m.28449 type:complete len:371 (+) Transcript_13157:6114-7226(+)